MKTHWAANGHQEHCWESGSHPGKTGTTEPGAVSAWWNLGGRALCGEHILSSGREADAPPGDKTWTQSARPAWGQSQGLEESSFLAQGIKSYFKPERQREGAEWRLLRTEQPQEHEWRSNWPSADESAPSLPLALPTYCIYCSIHRIVFLNLYFISNTLRKKIKLNKLNTSK